MKATLIFAAAILLSPLTGQTAETPFSDAVAVWHFGDEKDSAQRHPLIVRGTVQLGVALAGEERAVSLARGGDGAVARFDGGHLEIGGLEIFHASTRDLVHWRHHPVAVPISEQWEAWKGTGNTVFHNGKFWMFYPTPDYDGQRGGIQLATSDDGEGNRSRRGKMIKEQP